MSSSLDNYLDELSDLSKPLATSKLANLSELAPNEIGFFDNIWPDINVERRRQIAERLLALTAIYGRLPAHWMPADRTPDECVETDEATS